MAKKKSKTFTLTVALKNKDGGVAKDAPDFGMGKGVLMTQEISFTDARGQGFNTPMFALARMNHQERLADELLCYVWKEKRPTRRKRN